MAELHLWDFWQNSDSRYACFCIQWRRHANTDSRAFHVCSLGWLGQSSKVFGVLLYAAGSMQRYGVRPSVRPSVCLSQKSTAAAACGGFAAVSLAGRRYRSITARPVPSSNGAAAARRSATNASSVTFTVAAGGWAQTRAVIRPYAGHDYIKRI